MTKTIKNIVAVVAKAIAVVVAIVTVVAMVCKAVKKFTSKANVVANAKPIVPNAELEQVGFISHSWGHEMPYINAKMTELYDNNNQLMFVYNDDDNYVIEDGVLVDTNEYPFDVFTRFDLTKGAIINRKDVADIVEFDCEGTKLYYIITKDYDVFDINRGNKETLAEITTCRSFFGEESHVEVSKWDDIVKEFNLAYFKQYRTLN